MTTPETTPTAQSAAVAAQGPTISPSSAASTKSNSPKKARTRVKAAAKPAKAAAKNPAAKKAVASPKGKASCQRAGRRPSVKTKPAAARECSKKELVIRLLRRKEGATLGEIAKATGWQKHSIRGFVSGQLIKLIGLTVDSSKNAAGERVYRITR